MSALPTSAAERAALLAEVESAAAERRSRRQQAARVEYQAAVDDHDLEIRSARERHAAHADELAAQLADDVRSCLWPLLAKLSDDRSVVAAIASWSRAADAKCRDEQGTELSPRMLVLGLAAAHGVLDRWGGDDIWNRGVRNDALDAVDRAIAAITSGSPAIVIEAELHAAEHEIAKRAMGYEPDEDRALMLASRATTEGSTRAAVRFDEQRIAAAREATEPRERERLGLWARVQDALLGGRDTTAPRAAYDAHVSVER